MGDYQKSEELVLADRIYYCSQRKKMLERELDEKEFQYRCIPQKKINFSREIKMKIIPMILFTAIVIYAVVIAINDIIIMAGGGASGNAGVGITFLFAGPIAILGGYRCFQQWKYMLQMFVGSAEANAREESLREDIYRLKTEIEELHKEVRELQNRADELEQSRNI